MTQERAPIGRRTDVDARVVKTRLALARAVLALSDEKDFSDVTIAEIATRANVGYATFFRHYPDKESLLVAVADPVLDELLSLLLPGLLQEDTRTAAITLCQFVSKKRGLCRALLASGAAAPVRRRLIERATAHQWESRLEAAAPRDLRDLVVAHAVTATLGLLSSWLTMDNHVSTPVMGALLDGLVFAPIRRLDRFAP